MQRLIMFSQNRFNFHIRIIVIAFVGILFYLASIPILAASVSCDDEKETDRIEYSHAAAALYCSFKGKRIIHRLCCGEGNTCYSPRGAWKAGVGQYGDVMICYAPDPSDCVVSCCEGKSIDIDSPIR